MFRIFLLFGLLVTSSFSLQWMPWKADQKGLINGGVIGGYQKGAPNYVIRARHNDGLYPGHYNKKNGKALFPINGREVEKQNFEVLIGNNEILWSEKSDPSEKKASLRAGYSTQGHSLFVCRAWVGAQRIPGRLQDKKCFVSQNGIEQEMKDYEALKLM